MDRFGHLLGALPVLLVVAVVAACGEGESPSSAATLRVTVSEPSPERFRYSARRTVPAGLVRITLVNRGQRAHKAQLWRIQGGHSVQEALRARRLLPDWLFYEGGVGETPPGRTASVLQRLRPGRYYIADSAGDRGKVAPFEVRGEESDAELPSATGSIVMNDYSFTTAALRPGLNSTRVTNEGFEPHHTVVAPVKRGRSVAELRRLLRGSRTIPVGDVVDLKSAEETSVIEQGQEQVVDLRLRRGTYALLCFVADRKGGPPHVVKGMVDQLTVR